MSEERQFDNFDEHAVGYRETHDKVVEMSGADSDYFSEYKIVELLKFEKANDSLNILDFGWGDGNSSVFIRKHFSNANMFGADVSKASVKIANDKKISNAIFKVYDGVKLPFDDNQFDVVFTSMVFHHIEHKLHTGILSEIKRVLKKGGRFYNFEHNPNNPLTRKVVRECEFDEDAVLLKPSYNKRITNESGLKTEGLNYTLFFPRHKLFKIFLGLEKMLSWCPIGAQYYIRAIKKA
jgi:ubiquinone/menaquinone biosynthesis C-methylase UbiE